MRYSTTIVAILMIAAGLIFVGYGIAVADEMLMEPHNGITYSERAAEPSVDTGALVLQNGITAFEGGVVETREISYAAGGPAAEAKPLSNGITVFDSSVIWDTM